jgi:opacity protein-like surface antigen
MRVESIMRYFVIAKAIVRLKNTLAKPARLLASASVASALLLASLAACTPSLLHAQAIPTATAAGSLQVGAMFNLANSDYAPERFKGYGFYATFDFRRHIGIEGEFHQIDDPVSSRGLYERTYEIGPRYVLHYRRFNPYAKGMYGRGVFNYPTLYEGTTALRANLAYNIAAAGVGVDYRVIRSVNVRVEYEFQHWFSFPPNGLAPSVFSVGAAYHFH